MTEDYDSQRSTPLLSHLGRCHDRWSHLVKEFTEGSSGQACPERPQVLSPAEVSFIIRMVASELVELAQTVCPDEAAAVAFVQERVNTDVKPYPGAADNTELCADQADAAVDIMYYLYNCYARQGINLDAIFEIVHAANMAKRDPATGQFIRRPSDGKVIKPAGWQAPDIAAEIRRQEQEGAWK